jgi:predicted NAD/FAD-dependent oxidoreductase
MNLRIAIIGAGMAGVSAGRLLADRGHCVTLLEKSRGCGGRCATKRWEGHIVGHGAQYFTLRHTDFSLAVHQAYGESLGRIIAPVLDQNGAPLSDTGRYYRRDGNSRLVRGMVERRWGLCSDNFVAALAHRWRYARAAQPHANPVLPEHCDFAGDALTASRVEDAWLAGRAAALNIIQSHSNH